MEGRDKLIGENAVITNKYFIKGKDCGYLTALFLTEFTRGAFFLTFLPVYSAQVLGFSVTAAGFAVSAHYLVETLCKVIAGWQYDRLGGTVLRRGLALGLLALIIMRFYPSPALLIIASGIFGLGVSPLWPGVVTEVAPVNIKNRSSRIGLVFATWLAGAGSGMVGINFVMSAGYEFSFNLIIAILGLAFITVIALLPPASVKNSANNAPSAILKTLEELAESPAVTRILLPGMFLQTMAAGLLLPVLPVFARSRLGLDHDGYGLLLLTGGLATVIFLIPMGKIADKIKLKTILFIGFLFTAASLGAIALIGSADNAYYLVSLLGISYAAVLPSWNSLLARAIPPERQATGWGVFATIEGLGVAVGPALGSTAGRFLGTDYTIYITTVLLLGMALFYLLYPVEKLFITSYNKHTPGSIVYSQDKVRR